MWSAEDIFYIPSNCRGIGDHLQFSRLPEFYKKELGLPFKLYVDDKYNVFKYLPDIEFIDHKNYTINLWTNRDPWKIGNASYRQLTRYSMYPEKIDYNIKPIYIKPRKIQSGSKKVAICSQGAKRTQKNWCNKIPNSVSKDLVNSLKERYTVIQIGGSGDYKIEGIDNDFRGKSLEDTANLLETCFLFIGVNSGMMHLANCVDGIKCWVYLEVPVELPVKDSNLKLYPTNEWLYEDSTFISTVRYTNVLPYKEVLEDV